ncbi:PREDICTED: probable ribonuclease 11 [Chrysochloris asiatica]|uniref:Probable ribonuclease 11 n=1 Tax=Chrysochloris asiatica TaxID=185453 RepID=A0A9B0TBQ8_CHRAS|nr:PREDICTED: probable ribonuclease 11 [Chrysochloris asiatica]
METLSLLLLNLGLVLAEASGNTMKIIKEEFLEEEMEYDIAKSGQEKQTIEGLTNWTLLDKNTNLSMSKDVMFSSLMTFRSLQYSFPKGNSPGGDRECCNAMVFWRTVSEANGSYKLRNNFIHDSTEMMHGIPKFPSCRYELNLDMVRGNVVEPSCYESPKLKTVIRQLPTEKQFPRCQYNSVTAFKKLFTVLTGHSLMSWLVSLDCNSYRTLRLGSS